MGDAGRHRLEARRSRPAPSPQSATRQCAMSMSPGAHARRVLRIAPPTTRASSPASVEHREKLCAAGASPSHGRLEADARSLQLRLTGHEPAVLLMRRNISRAGPRTSPLRQHHKAADHQHERRDEQPANTGPRSDWRDARLLNASPTGRGHRRGTVLRTERIP